MGHSRSSAKNVAPGTVISGAYRIVRPLASGGMGTVYEAVQIATGARRALKVMHGEFADNEGIRGRFVREARLAASIPSDHVAQVVDAGRDEESGALYIVLELLEGSTLSREVRARGAFAWPDVLEILRQIAHALASAHACGIVHRDLKPANIFLSRSRHVGLPLMVKVLDFGIAKAMEGSSEATGVILGTPAWMAPEQSSLNATIGPQADVWSFGLIAFLLLTGAHFFESANVRNAPTAVILREVVLDPLPPASERAAKLGRADRLPADFDGWLARCLDRNPEGRFRDAAEAYAALAQLTSPTPADPIPTFTATEATPSQTPAPFDPPDPPVTMAETPGARSRAGPPTSGAPVMSTGAPIKPGLARGAMVLIALGLLVAATLGVSLTLQPPKDVTHVPLTPALPPVTEPILRLHGSNTIGEDLGPTLAEAFLQRRTAAQTIRKRTAADEMLVEAVDGSRVVESIEVFAHGSKTAFTDLLSGQCDVGMSSSRIHPDEASRLSKLGDMMSPANEHVVALDGMAIVVNPSNPVSALTKTQVADIFSGKIRNWSEVGGKNQPMTLYARDDKSGTYDWFKQFVLGDRPLSAEAKRFEASNQLSDWVAGDPAGIGFIGLPYIRSAKAVLVQDARSVPLLPSPLTVSTEDYALSRRLYLYTPTVASPVARDFVDFALSEEGQKVVPRTGFVNLRPECDPNASQCTACSAHYREVVRSACRISVDFRFDRGSTELDTRALRDLQRIVTLMGHPENASRSMVLLGFSDGTGLRTANVTLSEQRASIVAEQLRARGLHIDTARGFGPEMPIADDTTEGGRERNRRVEVWLR